MLTIICRKRERKRVCAGFPTLLWGRASGECMRYPPLAQGERDFRGTRIAGQSADREAAPRLADTNAAMPVPNQALPGGYQLLNYRIDRQISRGGFSIVYRAFDETGAPVA